MNRAERRRSARQAEKPKTYVLTEDQINKIKMDAVREATRKAFLMFMSIPIMVLHDKFGFGKIRAGRFMDYALVWFESVHDNETGLMELVKIAEEECGIKTTTWEGNNDHYTSRSNQETRRK
jgi:hypothetical protein